MRFGFIATFTATVLVAALVGIMWAFFTSPNSIALEEDGFHSIIATERNAVINGDSQYLGD